MKKMFNVRMAIFAIVLFVVSAVERLITFFIDDHFQIGSETITYHVISIIILVVLFIVTTFALKPLVYSRIITKTALKKEYIGGRWVEIITYTDGDKVMLSHCSVVDIKYEEDMIGTFGKAFRYCNSRFESWYGFKTTKSVLDNYKLHYTFIADGADVSYQNEGTLEFEEKVKSRPTRFHGRFEDGRGRINRIDGFLMAKKEHLKMLDKDQTTALSKIVPELNDEFMLGLTF